MSRLVAVSNRVSIPGHSIAPVVSPSALLSALRQSGGMWFGWSGNQREDAGVRARDASRRTASVSSPSTCRTRRSSSTTTASAIPRSGRCTTTSPAPFATMRASSRRTWPSTVSLPARWRSCIQAGDTIWVHDYQLMPLGSLLRQLGVRRASAFSCTFLIRTSRVLRMLPVYAELVRDLCQYDLVGFPDRGRPRGLQLRRQSRVSRRGLDRRRSASSSPGGASASGCFRSASMLK